MSEEQLKAFLKAVQSDTGLQEKLKSAQTLEDAAAIAKEAGYTLSSQEFQTALEDAELEAAAGGTLINCFVQTTFDGLFFQQLKPTYDTGCV